MRHVYHTYQNQGILQKWWWKEHKSQRMKESAFEHYLLDTKQLLLPAQYWVHQHVIMDDGGRPKKKTSN